MPPTPASSIWTLSNGQAFAQIGSDQGLLPAPVAVKTLTVAPAERADVVVDFAGQGGAEIELRSGEFRLMQFRVKRGRVRDGSSLPARLRAVPRLRTSAAAQTRLLSLNDYDDPTGRPSLMLLNATRWAAAVTEQPALDSVEVWAFANLTEDAHPMHLHLVRFQVLDRRPFDVFTWREQPPAAVYRRGGAARRQRNGLEGYGPRRSAMVTRIITRFEGFTGRYVWHCHILEHGDNEMMRPYEVVAGV